MSGDAAFNLPVLSLSASGLEVGAIFNLPKLAIDGAGLTGILGTSAFTLPKLTLQDQLGTGESVFSLPVLALSSSGFSDVGTSEFTLPLLILAADGITGGVGTAEFSLLGLTLSATAIQSGLGNAAFDLPVLRLSADGVTGNFGVAAFNLPILTLAGFGLHDGAGNAAFSLPILFLDAQGAEVLTAAFRTWVLNTRKGSLTEYNNFAFNSYATFNGQVLACGTGGVVVLGTQGLDGAVPIVASWRTGMNDFGVSVHKRVPRAYLDGSQSGDLHFKSITVEGGMRTYLLPWNNLSGNTQRRIPVGKGPRSRFFQFQVDNVAGADFSTTSLMAYPQKLRRRVS